MFLIFWLKNLPSINSPKDAKNHVQRFKEISACLLCLNQCSRIQGWLIISWNSTTCDLFIATNKALRLYVAATGETAYCLTLYLTNVGLNVFLLSVLRKLSVIMKNIFGLWLDENRFFKLWCLLTALQRHQILFRYLRVTL